MPSPSKGHTKKRSRPKSPGPRVNLKKLRKNLYEDPEIMMAPPMSASKVPFLLKGGKKTRKMARKMQHGLPKNVEFVGLLSRKQAHKLMQG